MENKQTDITEEIAKIGRATSHITTLADILYRSCYDGKPADELCDIAAALSDSIKLQASCVQAAATRAELAA